MFSEIIRGLQQLYQVEKDINPDKSFLQLVCKTVTVAVYMGFSMSFNKSPSSNLIKNDKVVVPYYIHGQKYITLLKNSHGAKPFVQFTYHDKNVSETVIPYMGPNLDFHGETFTPAFWNFHCLTMRVMNVDGNFASVKFEKDEPIIPSSFISTNGQNNQD